MGFKPLSWNRKTKIGSVVVAAALIVGAGAPAWASGTGHWWGHAPQHRPTRVQTRAPSPSLTPRSALSSPQRTFNLPLIRHFPFAQRSNKPPDR